LEEHLNCQRQTTAQIPCAKQQLCLPWQFVDAQFDV